MTRTSIAFHGIYTPMTEQQQQILGSHWFLTMFMNHWNTYVVIPFEMF